MIELLVFWGIGRVLLSFLEGISYIYCTIKIETIPIIYESFYSSVRIYALVGYLFLLPFIIFMDHLRRRHVYKTRHRMKKLKAYFNLVNYVSYLPLLYVAFDEWYMARVHSEISAKYIWGFVGICALGLILRQEEWKWLKSAAEIFEDSINLVSKRIDFPYKIIFYQGTPDQKHGSLRNHYRNIVSMPHWMGFESSTYIYEHYLFAPVILEEIYKEQIADLEKYLCMFSDSFYSTEQKSVSNIFPMERWKKLILLYRANPQSETVPVYPVPEDQIYHVHYQDNQNYATSVIHMLDENYELREYLCKLFQTISEPLSDERGKQYAQLMISFMLKGYLKETEYFYELIKLAEFMIHYKSLADYERLHSSYLMEDISLPLGTLADNIKDSSHPELSQNEDYKGAVEYLYELLPGVDDAFSKDDPLGSGRRILVTLRNRSLGHGAVTYAVTDKLVEQTAIVVFALAEDFLSQEEPFMEFERVYGLYEKFRQENGHLYLLMAMYGNGTSFHYLDYATGEMVHIGTQLKVFIGKK